MAKTKRQRELDEYNKRINREKASATKQEPVTVLNKNKASSQAWAEDRPKALSSKIGSPRKSDAQIIYDDKKFNKRKKTKHGGKFDWDGDMLKELPSKRYGRSYADRFNKLADEAGIPMAERGAFKDYMDAKEYGASTTADYDKAKASNEKNVASTMQRSEREKKRTAEKKKAEEIKTSIDSKRADNKKGQGAFGKSMDFLASLTAFDDVGYQREQEEKKKAGVERSEADRLATRVVNASNMGIPAQLQKRATGEKADYMSSRKIGEGGGSDIIAEMLGYLAPGTAITKGARALGLGAKSVAGMSKAQKVGQLAKEGATVGAGMSAIEVGGREALNPEDYNWKQNAGQIALETGAGALLDPLVSLGGSALKKGIDKSVKGAVDSTNMDVISRMMKDVGEIPTMPSPLDDLRPRQNQLERLTQQAQANQVKAPNLGPEFQTDVQAINQQFAKPSPDAPLEEKMAYWKDPNTPRTEEDVQEIYRTMIELEEKANVNIDLGSPDTKSMVDTLAQNEPELKKAYSDYENTKLQLESLSGKLDEWQATKEMKDLYKERPDWLKFAMPEPERLSGDYDVPKRFLMSNKNKGGHDIFSASEEAGFGGDIDAFVDHLQSIDASLRTKKKDLIPEHMNAQWVKEQSRLYSEGEEILKSRIQQEMGITPDLKAQVDELSELMTPYDPASALDEVAMTSSAPESMAIEQAPTVASSPEPKMARVKNQETLQAQALDVVVNQPSTLKTIISKGTKESEVQAQRIIDTVTKNPVMKVFRKYRQAMVGSKNSATYAERHLLKQEIPRVQERLASATTDGERASLQYELEDLQRRFKATKDTSYTQMALENETGAGIKASNIANDFVKKLSSIEGATVPEMANWQLAKRIMWLQGSENAGKDLPESWVRFAKQTIEDGQGNPAYQQSEAIFRELQETRLANLGQQKSQAEIEALLNEPYYIPLYLDKTYKVAKGNNSGKGLKGMRSQPRPTSSEADTIKAFTNEESAGSQYEFIQNPLESIIDDLFREQRSIARNDTAQQFRKLSQMDEQGLFVTEIDEKKFNVDGGEDNPKYLKGYANGEPFYLEIHPEFRKMLQENDTYAGTDPVQIATSIMSKLKTTSPEYLMTAIFRDLATSFLNTESPVKYAQGLFDVMTDPNYRKTGYDSGVQFRNAYDPQSAAQDTSKQLQKEIKEMAGFTDVDASNIEKATSLVSKAWDKLTTPVRWAGQISDDVPRLIEANIVKERWEKNVISKTRAEIDNLTRQLETAPKGDFEDGNTSQLQSQLDSLNERLAMETRSMEREMTHRGRDVMPYQRSGSSYMATAFKKYVNFANTTTQSKDKLARTFTRDPIGTSLKGLALAGPMTAITYQLYDSLSEEEKAEYDAIEDYMKQQRYILPLGEGQYVSVPKVQELGIISNLVEAESGIMSYESALDYAGKELTPFQMGGLTQGLVGGMNEEGGLSSLDNVRKNAALPGTFLTPPLDVFANMKTSFNGKPITYNREGASDDWTMDLFADPLGNTNWADSAQYMALQYGGDWGKYGLRGLDALVGPSPEDSIAARQNLNPLQDYLYRPNSKNLKEMIVDKKKLEK